MSLNKDDFEPFVEDNVDFFSYLSNMYKDGVYGGNLELVAFSRIPKSYEIVTSKHHPCSLGFPDPQLPTVQSESEKKKQSSKEKIIMKSTGIDDIKLVGNLLKKFNGDVDKVIDAIYNLEDNDSPISLEDQIKNSFSHEKLEQDSHQKDKNSAIDSKKNGEALETKSSSQKETQKNNRISSNRKKALSKQKQKQNSRLKKSAKSVGDNNQSQISSESNINASFNQLKI
ncbi:hypothetical protein AYI68_g3878 [Smittium mucronatum]|uniref:Uncharacterized protein n=1 Tax=Smittium mucronatum TaxID=133383 RepID=A0A1R0GYP4_9FUNG|nr:hypothetical protein AYI68_g3878 [Smittium mucronatum]